MGGTSKSIMIPAGAILQGNHFMLQQANLPSTTKVITPQQLLSGTSLSSFINYQFINNQLNTSLTEVEKAEIVDHCAFLKVESFAPPGGKWYFVSQGCCSLSEIFGFYYVTNIRTRIPTAVEFTMKFVNFFLHD